MSVQKLTKQGHGAQYKLTHMGSMWKVIGDTAVLAVLEYPKVCNWCLEKSFLFICETIHVSMHLFWSSLYKYFFQDVLEPT